ncbi:Transmembrane domain-containing protein [Cedratvirus Zaza IHUMI]|uniref:Transmembrane domain-containing protein n=1 Tax=Cedratvirus Zaza IHUMI TaxID=2126979 RepID=A0A2R8FDF4_9VIRU|nr:Transmembrane domain-containing protein [Cedratvirus Zaza IHUMI]
MPLLEELLKACFIGTGSIGALLGILCAFLLTRAIDVQPSLLYAIIGGTLGALFSCSLGLLVCVLLLMKMLR